MSLTKQDKKEIKETIQDEIIDAVAEGVTPMMNRLENSLMNKIGKRFETVQMGMEKINNNISDIKRQVSDLNVDTPTKVEFAGHGKRIYRLEKHLSFA